MRIRDEIALGCLTGITATIPQLIFDFISVQLGYSKHYAFQISASIYLTRELTIKPLGLLLGGLVWEAMAAFLGVLTVLLLRFTGKDYWWLKGLAISNILMYIIVFGFLYTLGIARIIPLDIPTNMTVFIGNVIYGLTVGYLIVQWGEEDLVTSP
jgi:hypothetical protein